MIVAEARIISMECVRTGAHQTKCFELSSFLTFDVRAATYPPWGRGPGVHGASQSQSSRLRRDCASSSASSSRTCFAAAIGMVFRNVCNRTQDLTAYFKIAWQPRGRLCSQRQSLAAFQWLLLSFRIARGNSASTVAHAASCDYE